MVPIVSEIDKGHDWVALDTEVSACNNCDIVVNETTVPDSLWNEDCPAKKGN